MAGVLASLAVIVVSCGALVSGDAQPASRLRGTTSAVATQTAPIALPTSAPKSSTRADTSTDAQTEGSWTAPQWTTATVDPGTGGPVRPQPPADTSESTPAQDMTTALSQTSYEVDDPLGSFTGARLVDASDYPGYSGDDYLEGLAGFVTPSGNISCLLVDVADEGGFVCHIIEHDFPLDAASNCYSNDRTVALVQEPGDWSAIECTNFNIGGDRELAYGDVIVFGESRCVSREDGVTCQDLSSGYGFRIARAAYALFGPGGDIRSYESAG